MAKLSLRSVCLIAMSIGAILIGSVEYAMMRYAKSGSNQDFGLLMFLNAMIALWLAWIMGFMFLLYTSGLAYFG